MTLFSSCGGGVRRVVIAGRRSASQLAAAAAAPSDCLADPAAPNCLPTAGAKASKSLLRLLADLGPMDFENRKVESDGRHAHIVK